jgi:hypothetical protein
MGANDGAAHPSRLNYIEMDNRSVGDAVVRRVSRPIAKCAGPPPRTVRGEGSQQRKATPDQAGAETGMWLSPALNLKKYQPKSNAE